MIYKFIENVIGVQCIHCSPSNNNYFYFLFYLIVKKTNNYSIRGYHLLLYIYSVYLSKTNCSNPTRSQAMYSRAASVTRGHQDKSKICNFGRFSAISSIPSSVILLHPDRLSTVRLGSE